MSNFEKFNAENKLRIPLSEYAAYIIENDQKFFSMKKTTLINTIIINFNEYANCSISIQLKKYKNELEKYFLYFSIKNKTEIINELLRIKENELCLKYVNTRITSDVNWQITLNKEVKNILTSFPYTEEEKYYKKGPGKYIHELLEEYTKLPHHRREEIVYADIINSIKDAINTQSIIVLTNSYGEKTSIKPYKLTTDPLSMYHYIVGYNMDSNPNFSKILSMRISRIKSAKKIEIPEAALTKKETALIQKELSIKGVPFLSGNTSNITVWLSDKGIKKYNSQIHLRPIPSNIDGNLYTFNCTTTQIMFYFISFGEDAKIISPDILKEQFANFYKNALNNYT